MKFVLKKKKKKKKFLKPKQICILYTKNLKRKKKMKRKEMNNGTYTAKKYRIKKFETQNLKRDTIALVLVEDTEVTNKEECKTQM